MTLALLITLCWDCGAFPGRPHRGFCDIAQCTECGHQRISCMHGNQRIGWGQTWTGEWPGEAECIKWGWYAKFSSDTGWVRTDAADPDGSPDLNRLDDDAVWDRQRQRYVLF